MGIFVIEYSNLAPIKALAEAGAFLVGLLLSFYSVGRHARDWQARVGVLLVAAAVPLGAIEPGQPFSFSDVAFFVVFSAGPWGAGRFVRHRVTRERDLLGRAAQLEVERDTRAREAVAEERTRIARESSRTRSA
jgi:signal transduction histidine kinase